MKVTASLSTLFVVLILSACSEDGGKTEVPGEGALGKISPAHRAAFELWQASLVKSCDVSEVFGFKEMGSSSESKGLDAAILLKRNDGSIVFSDEKNLILLTGYSPFSGVGATKAEETSTVDGRQYSISAETKREGSVCSVFLFGQKVYESEIMESFLVGSHFSVKKEASTISPIPVVKQLGVNGYLEVIQHGIFTLLNQAFKPVKDAPEIVGNRLGLSPEESTRFIRLSKHAWSGSSIRLAGDPASVWSNYEGGNLISSSVNLRKYFDGSSQDIPFEVRIQLPQFNFLGAGNVSDNGNLKHFLTVSVQQSENGYLYNLTELKNEGLVPFSQVESEACARERVQAYLGAVAGNKSISPSIQTMFGPCKTLLPDIEGKSYGSGLLKSLIPVVLSNVLPSAQLDYGGWDFVLSYFVKEARNHGRDIVTELDPGNKTKVVSLVARNIEAIEMEVAKVTKLNGIKENLYQMGLDWSLSWMNVPRGRITQIVQSLDNVADVFSASAKGLVRDLARNPHLHDDQLAFALGVDLKHKKEAIYALGLARDLAYEAFEPEVYSQVLQKQTSYDDFKRWSHKLLGLKIRDGRFVNPDFVQKNAE